MAKQKKPHVTSQSNKQNFWGAEIEYVMPREMFNNLTAECKGDKVQYAMDYINTTYGLLGHVTSLAFMERKVEFSPSADLE